MLHLVEHLGPGAFTAIGGGIVVLALGAQVGEKPRVAVVAHPSVLVGPPASVQLTLVRLGRGDRRDGGVVIVSIVRHDRGPYPPRPRAPRERT
ncbi:hypothetical protein Cs7R123_68580 [Catellatospora sp. TT07R-123]|nr:hypothetical protein Cs7R123_68580 [Catellatospora sp. TT07R-123]